MKDPMTTGTQTKSRGITNSHYDLLCMVNQAGPYGITAMECFKQLYKTSRFPMRKVAGIYRKLHRLSNQGLLFQGGGSCAFIYTEVRFTLRNEGRRVGLEERARRDQWEGPTFPRLAQGEA